MSIILGWTPTPEGDAALARARAEAVAHGQDVLVVNVSATADPPEETLADAGQLDHVRATLDGAGVTHEVRQLVGGRDAADAIVELAAEVDAEMIVIGLRHRSPVGKLLLGSTSQRILLEAGCPVLAVKARR